MIRRLIIRITILSKKKKNRTWGENQHFPNSFVGFQGEELLSSSLRKEMDQHFLQLVEKREKLPPFR